MIKPGTLNNLSPAFNFNINESIVYRPIKKLFPVIILVFIAYFGFWWLYKLDVLPGLHGDEAWVGLKANEFSRHGIDHLYGMNTYTGILQPLAARFVFQLFNVGVFQLRVSSVLFNLMGLLIIGLTLYKNKLRKMLVLFLLIISQSALYLISPRVAWEVNTFTLFFLSLLLASAFKIINGIDKPKNGWVLVFWVGNILGTYNHVIFSCLSIAALTGVTAWSLYTQSLFLKNAVYILLINLLNLILVYLCMKYWLDIPMFKTPYVLFVVAVLLLAQIYMLKVFIKLPFGKTIKIAPWLMYIVLIVAFFCFAFYHGIALWQVMANYKLLIHAYSYQPPLFFELIFLAAGCLFAIYVCYFLFKDITRGGPASLYAFIIAAYMALLPFYTTNCSFRYYLSIYAILALYMALKISENLKLCVPVLASLVITICLLNGMLINIFTSVGRPIKAMDFKIGNGQVETSAHFLPNKPLIDFIKKNRIGKVTYIADQYFLEQPVLFYQLINPWQGLPANTAIIDYDFTGYKQGYMLYMENSKP
ncbi:MAG: hypothetical protein JWQ66_1823 [Mucilaginibacter sp.]|nr:hypothetical protein [Mucilaginibacter sp.]